MQQKTHLTSENLNKRFENPFLLVNYAIDLAKKHIHQGDWIDLNPANEVVELIDSGEDEFEMNQSSEPQ